MKNKLLLTVYVPIMERSFDLMVPINRKVKEIKEMIINSVVDLTDNMFVPTDGLKLYSKETGASYNEDLYVLEVGLKNGDKIVLI
jgi:hypothetical protein